jgi:hypothetical protein
MSEHAKGFKKYSKSEMNKVLNEINEKIDLLMDEVHTLSEEIWEMGHLGDKSPEEAPSEPAKELKKAKKGKTLRKKPKA